MCDMETPTTKVASNPNGDSGITSPDALDSSLAALAAVSSSSSYTAGLNCEQLLSLDNISINSDASLDHQLQHQQLHQTTQSLLMASSMMAGIVGGTAELYDVNFTAGGLPNSCSGSIFGSTESVGTTTSTSVSAVNTIKVNLEELLRENYALRERLKEVTSDRDRLLCEVSNLRLELDMSELKRLPEGSFPQKPIERSNTPQYAIAAPPGSISSTSSASVGGGVGGGGYIYLQQQQYVPSTASSNSSVAINYPPATQQQHMIYQHYNPQYPTCHQQQLTHQSANVGSGSLSSLCSSPQMMTAASGGGVIHYNPHQQQQQQHHHILHGHHHHHHHGGAVVIAGSGVGTGVGIGSGNGGGGSSPLAMQQNMHKKNSIRNGVEVLKRSRAQTAYELSQDLLEKQIELLERKYGGVCARNAAITIQRAFRHYMMVKKFASITAMAKAEKRLSRRMLNTPGDEGPASNTSSSSAYGSATESQLELTQNQAKQQQQHQQQQPRVTIMAGPPGGTGNVAAAQASSRTPPTRSLSLRERRQLDSSPIPRSQSGASPASNCSPIGTIVTASTHPHVNLLHAAEPHYYTGAIIATNASGQTQQFYPAHCSGGVAYHAIPHDVSLSSVGSANLDSSLNVSWVSAGGSTVSGTSPHTPYYSAAQIYMRPKGLTPNDRKKVPPEVPKRTSSITAQQQAQQLAAQQHQQMIIMRQTPPPPSMMRSNGLCKTSENGSLTSVQSSGSDSSVTSAERIANSDLSSDRSNSPNTWKRGTNLNSSNQFSHSPDPTLVLPPNQVVIDRSGMAVMVSDGVVSTQSSDENVSSSHTSAAQYGQQQQEPQQQDHQINVVVATTQNYKVSETIRKRQYRVGLNLFNKKPEKGLTYLIRRGFVENTPHGVARFLITRKGLSRQMIGEYLGNLQNQFNMAVLNCFALELDLSGKQVDVALRKFQAYFRMPGEAQKIERLMEIFSHRYCQCNQDVVGRLRSSDTIFVLAFAIIMLNTDLHTPNLKPERRMRVEDFIKNLRGIDDCHDIDKDMLGGIYERVKADEFKPGSDHVTQVMKVQATIVGKKPNLALPHRRLVCYCRLYEIPDVNKKERPGVHQREVFLFNDLIVITKIFSKKKSSVTYTFRNSFPLCGMVVSLLDLPNYPFCIQLSQKVDGKNLVTFNARNEHDRCKFADDLKESISEMDEMESLRIEAELERQKSARNRATGNSENRDSGVADVEVCPCPFQAPQAGDQANGTTDSSQQLKRSALSNSLLDMHEQFGNEKPQRRGSVGSLDSGMSISFQSTTTSSASRENAAVVAAAANAAAAKMRFPPPVAVNTGAVGISYQHQASGQSVGYNHANLTHQQQAAFAQHMLHHQLSQQQQQHQQQSQLTGRIPGRERKQSRSDENGRSTDV